MNDPVGLLVGDASYSLYLIHPFVLRPAAKIWAKVVGNHLPPWTFTVVALFAALSAGIILYLVVEKRLTSYFGKKRHIAKLPSSDSFGQLENSRI